MALCTELFRGKFGFNFTLLLRVMSELLLCRYYLCSDSSYSMHAMANRITDAIANAKQVNNDDDFKHTCSACVWQFDSHVGLNSGGFKCSSSPVTIFLLFCFNRPIFKNVNTHTLF